MADVDDIVRGLTSDAQAALSRFTSGWRGSTFLDDRVMHVLVSQRLVEIDWNMTGPRYRLTPLGRDALARLLSSSGEEL